METKTILLATGVIALTALTMLLTGNTNKRAKKGKSEKKEKEAEPEYRRHNPNIERAPKQSCKACNKY